ncbi:hypothetical protein TNCV_2293981 [Trichonephila clavipes]|nr:hypothetical protein TNCV_2293981 [Trichonephila clavipes]
MFANIFIKKTTWVAKSPPPLVEIKGGILQTISHHPPSNSGSYSVIVIHWMASADVGSNLATQLTPLKDQP